MRKFLAAALLSTVGLFGASGAALAGGGPDVHFGIGIGNAYPGYYYGPPRAYYYAPPPVVYYRGGYGYRDDWRRDHWRHHDHRGYRDRDWDRGRGYHGGDRHWR